MKFLGKDPDADCNFHNLVEVGDNEIKTTPPKELENVVFEQGIDLVIYNNKNPNEYVVAVETEPCWYRRFIAEKK